MKRRHLAAAVFAGGLNVALGACGDSTPLPAPDAVTRLVIDTPGLTTVKPGSTFVEAVTDAATRKALGEALPLVDNQRPGGFEDPSAPIVGATPIRVLAKVAIRGPQPHSNLRNDSACDTLRVELGDLFDTKTARIGVIVLSDDFSDKVQINWSQNADGQPADSLQVCVAEDHEPSDGVVLVLTR